MNVDLIISQALDCLTQDATGLWHLSQEGRARLEQMLEPLLQREELVLVVEDLLYLAENLHNEGSKQAAKALLEVVDAEAVVSSLDGLIRRAELIDQVPLGSGPSAERTAQTNRLLGAVEPRHKLQIRPPDSGESISLQTLLPLRRC